jgi:hypothetical protein
MKQKRESSLSLAIRLGQEGVAPQVSPRKRLPFITCLVAFLFLAIGCKSGPPVSIELMPNSAQTLELGRALPISATLTNDPARKGVTWKLKGQGALVARTATSVMYQAPPDVNEGTQVTITAISVADGGKAATLTIILISPKRTTSAHRTIHKKTDQGVRG